MRPKGSQGIEDHVTSYAKERDRGLGILTEGRPLTGRQRCCLENTGCPVREVSFLERYLLVMALILVQSPFPV